MGFSKEYLKSLLESGITSDELMGGVDVPDGVFTRHVRVHKKKDIKILNTLRAKLILNANKGCNQVLTERVILQITGGGPLKRTEFLQINEINTKGSQKIIITGSRGYHESDSKLSRLIP